MALILPAFLAIVLGVFELGWAAYCGATVHSAVTHAARALISNASTSASDIQSDARARLEGVPVSDLAVTVVTQTVGSGQVALVSWRYTYSTMVPFLPNATLHFDSSTTVPIS
jgi:Flp pilus assembly protein TadG